MRWTVKRSIPIAGIVITIFLLFYIAMYLPHQAMVDYAPFLSFFLLFFIVITFFMEFESANISSKEVALVGTMGAIIAASRIPFAAVPSIQPCTFLIIAVGLTFGPLSGVMVGSLTPAVSNLFLGQGPWTVWQMVGWGIVGLASGYIGRKWPDLDVRLIAALAFVMGIMFSLFQDIGSWVWLYGLDVNKFLAVMTVGLPFTIAHAIGNVFFALILGKPVMFAFNRFQNKFHISYRETETTNYLESS